MTFCSGKKMKQEGTTGIKKVVISLPHFVSMKIQSHV